MLIYSKKYAAESRTQGLRHVIYIFFGSSLFFYHYRICVADFKEWKSFSHPNPWTAPKRPILNRVNDLKPFNHALFCIMHLVQHKLYFISNHYETAEVLFCFLWSWNTLNTSVSFNLTECNSRKFNVLMYFACLEISNHFHIDEFVSLTE